MTFDLHILPFLLSLGDFSFSEIKVQQPRMLRVVYLSYFIDLNLSAKLGIFASLYHCIWNNKKCVEYGKSKSGIHCLLYSVSILWGEISSWAAQCFFPNMYKRLFALSFLSWLIIYSLVVKTDKNLRVQKAKSGYYIFICMGK